MKIVLIMVVLLARIPSITSPDTFILFGDCPEHTECSRALGWFVEYKMFNYYDEEYVLDTHNTFAIRGETSGIIAQSHKYSYLEWEVRVSNSTEFIQAPGIKMVIMSPSGYKFHRVENVSLLVTHLWHNFDDATNICDAIGGEIVMPTTKSMLDQVRAVQDNNHDFWIGLHKRNGIWSWKENKGDGSYYNETQIPLSHWKQSGQDSYDCAACKHKPGNQWHIERCTDYNYVTCQYDNYIQFGNKLYYFHDKLRNIDQAAIFCTAQAMDFVSISSNEELNFLCSVAKFYKFKEPIMINSAHVNDTIYKSMTQNFFYDLHWKAGEPNTAHDCVVIDIEDGCQLRTQSCTLPSFFVCSVLDFDKHVVQDGNGFYYTYKNAVTNYEDTKCDDNMLMADDSLVQQIPFLIQLYNLLGEAAGDFWIDMKPDYTIKDGIIVPGVKDVASFYCPSVNMENGVDLKWEWCAVTEQHSVCRTEYLQEIFTEPAKYCPNEFTRVGPKSCMKYYPYENTWTDAHLTCKLNSSGLGNLIKTDNSADFWMYFEYIKKYLAIPLDHNVWTGMVVNETTGKAVWTGDSNFSFNTKLNFTKTMALRLSMSENNEIVYNDIDEERERFFICEVETAESLSTLSGYKLAVANYCPNGYFEYGNECVTMEVNKSTQWNYGCTEGSIATANEQDTIEILRLILQVYNYLPITNVWINMTTTSEENCPAISTNGMVTNVPCNATLPSFCATQQCFTFQTIYNGKISTTRSGFSCKPWSSTNGQYTNFPSNYCQNSQLFQYPWCYTNNDTMLYEVCDIDHCEKETVEFHPDFGVFGGYTYLSDFVREEDSAETRTFSCAEGEALLHCSCPNGNCVGIKLVVLSITATGRTFGCIVKLRHITEGILQTQVEVTCMYTGTAKHILSQYIGNTMQKTQIECPYYMALVGCMEFDSGLQSHLLNFGTGTPTTAHTCQTACTGGSCDHSTTCLINTETMSTLQTQFLPSDYIFMFPSNSETDDFLIHQTLGTDISMLCMWVQTHGELTGTIFHLSVDSYFPKSAVVGGSIPHTGIFLAPNGEEIEFDASAFTDNLWHYMCVVFGSEEDTCDLYIDGFTAASTSVNNTCGRSDLSDEIRKGYFVFGSGSAFWPRINSQPVHKSQGLSDLLQINFIGNMAHIETFFDRVNQSQIQGYMFGCRSNNVSTQMNEWKITEKVSYQQDSNFCFEALNRYTVNAVVTVQQYWTYTATVDVSCIPPNVAEFTAFGLTAALIKIFCYTATGTQKNDVYTEVNFYTTYSAPMTSLKAYTSYNCTAVCETDLWKNDIDNYLGTSFQIKTRIEKPTGLRSNAEPGLLKPGTDTLTWDTLPETYQYLDYYDIKIYKLHPNTTATWNFVFADTTTSQFYTIEMSSEGSSLAPGQKYRISLRAVAEDGIWSGAANFQSHLQPYAPEIVSLASSSSDFPDKVSGILTWTDMSIDHIAGYNLNYKGESESRWSYVLIQPAVTTATFVALNPSENYEFRLQSFVGDKSSNETSAVFRTDVLKFTEMNFQRFTNNGVKVSWAVNAECYRYTVVVKAVHEMNNDKKSCLIDETQNEITIADILCSMYIKTYMNTLTANVDGLVSDCSYQFSITELDEYLNALVEIKDVYTMPLALTKPHNLWHGELQSNSITVSWEINERENVDKFMVKLSKVRDPEVVIQYTIQSELFVTFGNLESAEEYFVNVTSWRDEESGSEYSSVQVWTLNWNTTELFSWTKWSEFSKCSHTCGSGGLHHRERFCKNPRGRVVKECGLTRESYEEQTIECILDRCPVNGGWSFWSDYSPCTKSCGGNGLRTRHRKCNNPFPSLGGLICIGPQEHTIQCGERNCPIHAGWSDWVKWFGCSVTCGSGTQEYKRFCNNPEAKYGGSHCVGSDTKVEQCNLQNCPSLGYWSGWTLWEDCSNDCGILVLNRTRMWNANEKQVKNNLYTPPPSGLYQEVEERQCTAKVPCENDYGWFEWSSFSQCTVTCGRGKSSTISRTRKCVWNDAFFQEQSPCQRTEAQHVFCGPEECPINGNWGKWTDWSPCSVKCDKGIQVRNRLCDNPKPEYGGQMCEESDTGSQQEIRKCFLKECAPGLYRVDPELRNFCEAGKGKTGKIIWPQTPGGMKKRVDCPKGTTGVAERICTKTFEWLQEDLSNCITTDIKNILNQANNSKTSLRQFFKISNDLLNILSSDTHGKKLKVPGDIPAIGAILQMLVKKNSITDNKHSTSDRFKMVDAVMSAVEKMIDDKYISLWENLESLETFEAYKNMFHFFEEVNRQGMTALENNSYSVYKNSYNRNFHVKYQSIVASEFNTGVVFPHSSSPEFQIEKSTLRIEQHENATSAVDPNERLRFSFIRFNAINKLWVDLPNKTSSVTHRNFKHRKLNSVIIGAQVSSDHVKNEKAILSYPVTLTFHHQRRSKNPLCVYVDMREGDWFFSENGCWLYRSNTYRTICKCNHLSLFAVLTHDLEDAEVLHKNQVDNFKEYMKNVTFGSLVAVVILLLIINLPRNFDSIHTGLSLYTVLSILLRHSAVLFFLLYPRNVYFAFISSAIVSYSVVVYSMQTVNRVTVTFHELYQARSTPNTFIFSWILPLIFPGITLMLIFYGDSQHVTIPEEVAFSIEVLLPALGACAFLLLMGFVCFIATSLHLKRNSKQVEALFSARLQVRLAMALISLILVGGVVYTMFSCLRDIGLPDHAHQIAYGVLSGLDLLFILYADVWLNPPIFEYYQQLFGTRPATQKAVIQPPKYIP